MSRRYFADCRIRVAAWCGREEFSCDDAEVWTEDESILVSYFDEDGIVVLEGVSDHLNGWILTARSRPWRATLSPEASQPSGAGESSIMRFAGSISEHDESGCWSLCLGIDETPR